MRPARVKGSSQGGYILVAVLGVMVILTSFMAAGSLLVRSALDTVRVGDIDVATSGLAQSGIELTAYQLFVVNAAPAAIDGHRIRLGGGTIAPRIVDEGGKADLNGSDPKLLDALFQSAGLDSRTAAELVAYIVEMRGADRNPSAASSPTSAPTQPQEGAKKTRRGFQSVDQLQDVPDLSRSDLQALRPLLTVFNSDGKINILSAKPTILKAIPGISSADVEVILARRGGADKKEIDNLLSLLKEAKTNIKTTFGPAFTVRVDAISPNGPKKAVNAVLAASKSPNTPYYVLDWWE